MQDVVRKIIKHIGDNPEREGVVETPDRVVKSWEELFSGYKKDPREYLSKMFSTDNSMMVCLNGIEFTSTCEHHMLPFIGTADIAYIPTTKVFGVSKLDRVVDGYARRLQIQEQLTDQIAEALATGEGVVGVAVRLRAKHSCMALRGVRKGGATMTTTALRGLLKADEAARREWIAGLPA